MKKEVTIIFLALSLVLFPTLQACELGVSLINQDPYPAIPGDYVKLVFQVDGVDNSECGIINFQLLEQYPLIFDPDEEGKYTINSGTYNKDFSSDLLRFFFVSDFVIFFYRSL